MLADLMCPWQWLGYLLITDTVYFERKKTMRIISYLYMFTIHTIVIGQLWMLPDGQVTTANDDIIEAFGTNTSRKCSIACRKSQSCTSFELQSNVDGTFVCTLRKTFITNPEHLVDAPGKSAFYLCKCRPKSVTIIVLYTWIIPWI